MNLVCKKKWLTLALTQLGLDKVTMAFVLLYFIQRLASVIGFPTYHCIKKGKHTNYQAVSNFFSFPHELFSGDTYQGGNQ
jgi:hypothetical protein